MLPDPCIMTIPATFQRINYVKISPFILSGNTNIQNHGIDILVRADAWGQTVITEDGEDSTSIYTVRTSLDFPGWYAVRTDLPNVDTRIEIFSPKGVLAYLSGSGHNEGYGFVADTTEVCDGTSVTFTATPTNGGNSIYKWFVNGQEQNETGATFTYIPNDGDRVTCELYSSLECATPIPVVFLPVEMTVKPKQIPTISIRRKTN